MDVVYDKGLAIIIDISWLGCVAAFERNGRYIASGAYHLPLFKGVPSRFILQEFSNKGDVEKVLVEQMKLGRIKPHDDCASVMVRIVDHSRLGHLDVPARILGRIKPHDDCGSVMVRIVDHSRLGHLDVPARIDNLRALRTPYYLNELGVKHVQSMRKEKKNKTYAK
eukprot:gene32638-17652_t